MKMKWLYTTAIAVTIAGGAAFAQAPEQTQKRDTSPSAQSRETERPSSQSTETDRSGAPDRAKERAQSDSERGRQAQEQQGRESREPNRQQSQEQGRERSPASTAQEEQKGRDSRQQATEQQQRAREAQKDERAQDAKRPSDAKQQQSQQEREGRDRRDQAAQPSGTSTQRTGDSAQDQRQNQRTGQAADRSNQRAANLNNDQRRQVVDQLRRERTAGNENVNVHVNVGERLPPRIEARRLPPDIISIVPQYRDYEYTMIEDRVAIIDPGSREVVDMIDEGPGYGGSASYGHDRITISDDTRARFRELVRSSSSTVGTASSGGATSASNCMSLQPVPEEMTRNNPELSNYRYLAVGDQIVLVDPQQQKVVQVID